MKVIKKINNNVAICLDKNNQELVVFGKGIGFKPIPYELEDLSTIERTFYGIDLGYLGLLKVIPEHVFQLSAKVVDYAKTIIDRNLNPNITFTLADHLNFAIERHHKKIIMKYPLQSGVERLYPLEMKIGHVALDLIRRDMDISLPSGEASSIAMHFINAQSESLNNKQITDNEAIIDQIVRIVESNFDITIDQDNFNYLRFVTHMKTLLSKKGENVDAPNEYKKIYASMKIEFPLISDCVDKIKQYLDTEFKWILNEEELLYLILHVNRLCTREDCYQQGITSTVKTKD